MNLATQLESDKTQTKSTATAAKIPLIYIAAPYTVPDPVENTHVACRIADALLEAGFTPVVPHLTMFWHLISPKPYGIWLAYDQELLRRCDVLLRIPGFSKGATQECTLADSLNIPVIRPKSNNPSDCVAAVTQFYAD